MLVFIKNEWSGVKLQVFYVIKKDDGVVSLDL